MGQSSTFTLPDYITGAYAVGTECFSVTDSGRRELLGTVDCCRKIAVRLYYPITPADAEGLTPAKVFSERKLAAVLKAFRLKEMNPAMLTAQFFENAPHPVGEKFPLLLFSCGYNSYIESNTLLCCLLASNGYFVASVGHANEAIETEYQDGTYDRFDVSIGRKMYDNTLFALLAQKRLQRAKGTPAELAAKFDRFQRKHTAFIMERVPQWEADMLFAADTLKSNYADYIDLSKGIGAAGHSLGGATAYALCQHNAEIACGINMDGALFGEYDGLTMQKPFLQIGCKENYNLETRSLIETNAPIQSEFFEHMAHIGFTDAKFYLEHKMLVGSMDGCELFRKLSDRCLQFLRTYL